MKNLWTVGVMTTSLCLVSCSSSGDKPGARQASVADQPDTSVGMGRSGSGGSDGSVGAGGVTGSGSSNDVSNVNASDIPLVGSGGSIDMGGASGPVVDAGGPRDAGGSTGSGEADGGGSFGGGGEGGAGDGSVADCNVLPATPNATPQAKKVLCYLYSQYGNHILSGQEEGGSDLEFDYIQTNTGKVPVIRGFEANGAGAATRCLPHWNAGGLCMFGYHMGAPGQPDGYQGSLTAVSIDLVLTPGTNENTVFNQRLDALGDRLLQVQAGNGVVIFRPFHEAGGTWFWWSMEGGAQYVRLWKYAFDRLTNGKGVRNALWLLAYNGSPQASFYPGKEYVDLGGADNYNQAFDYSPMTSIYNAARNIFGTTMPIALHECGPIVDPDMLQATKTNWLFFNIWTQPYPQTLSTVAELQKVYASSYVVTRDLVPNLR
jgi:Glycosyl hydrolase family 26